MCEPRALYWRNRLVKRSFDIVFSLLGILATGWLMAIALLVARWDTGRSGLFVQQRVGRGGRKFNLAKIRTMRDDPAVRTSVTTSTDERITKVGRLLRRTKVDELPQLFSVLRGDMSFVGPRPDVPGFADRLTGIDRLVLAVRPGITGPATLKYRNEEALLALHDDPERYNREVVFPDKVRLNREYVMNYTFSSDLKYILSTVFLR